MALVLTGSEKGAALRLGISQHTVHRHLSNARSRVGAATTLQLVWLVAARLPVQTAPRRRPDGMA